MPRHRAKEEHSLHEHFMRQAFKLAIQGRGATAPNPCVGALLVRDEQIVAQGWHSKYGEPHAERVCLHNAQKNGEDPAGCTLYVTLEPCKHHGKTPPCTEAIIEAGIKKVVYSCPDPTKAGGGGQILQAHNIEVTAGILKEQGQELIADFLYWQKTELPWCILKMASTLDGKIASHKGHNEAVSSAESFHDVHQMRAFADAIMIGGATFYADNPSLTCRLHNKTTARQPLAVILTTKLPTLPCNFTLLTKRANQTIFLSSKELAKSKKASALQAQGIQVLGLSPAPAGQYGLDLEEGLRVLRSQFHCHYVLCEGGGQLATALLEQKLVNKFVLYLAPRILADHTAPSVFSGRQQVTMAETMDLQLARSEHIGSDIKLTFFPK